MNLSFLKNKNAKAGSLYLISNFLNKAATFLTIPIFTRLLTTNEYGIVNTYISFVTIIGTFIALSLGSSVRTAFVDYKEDLDSYMSSIMFLSLLNFCVTSVLIVTITHFFVPQVDSILVVLCVIQAFMFYVVDSITIKYMMECAYLKRTFLIAIPNMLVIIVSIIFILLMNNNKHMGRIYAYVLVYSILGLSYLVSIFIKGKKIISINYWKYALKFSLPLVFHGLSMVILAQSDRTMITAMRNASETGIYSLVYNFSMIATVIISSLESVWIPWFTDKMNLNDKESINSNVKIYIEIVTVMIIGIILVAPEILIIMSPQEYWSGKVLIAPIVLASFFVFLYSISVNLEYYYKSTKIIAVNTIIAATINIILNYIFIPKYGAIAAAFTTVAAYAVSFGIHYRAARKLDSQVFPFRVYIKPISIMLLAVVAAYILMSYGVIRWIIALVGFGLYLLISYKKHRFDALLKK